MTNYIFIVPGSIAILLLIGLFLRYKFRFLQKNLLPASIIAGFLGFIVMNVGIIPVEQAIYEEVAFHLINLSFMSITLSSVQRQKRDKKDKSFLGGLWLALMFGGLYSLQAVVGGFVGLTLNQVGFDHFTPLLGTLNAAGFAQGPGQALALGRTWEGLGIPDAAQIGLFYAAAGYLAAAVVGIPLCNHFLKKRKIDNGNTAIDVEMSSGIYQTSSISMGKQTTHRSNLDTLTTHIAILFGGYLLTYTIVSFVCSFIQDAALSGGIYNMMFVWAILVSNLIKVLMRLFKCDQLIDSDVQISITNFLTDTLITACMMSISVTLISRYLAPIAVICIVIVILTAITAWYFAKRTGFYSPERFVTIFGICTGTAVTGILLLRVIDPEYKTPVAKELVWWNVLQMGAGLILGVAATAPAMGFWVWMAINLVGGAIYLLLALTSGKKLIN